MPGRRPFVLSLSLKLVIRLISVLLLIAVLNTLREVGDCPIIVAFNSPLNAAVLLRLSRLSVCCGTLGYGVLLCKCYSAVRVPLLFVKLGSSRATVWRALDLLYILFPRRPSEVPLNRLGDHSE